MRLEDLEHLVLTVAASGSHERRKVETRVRERRRCQQHVDGLRAAVQARNVERRVTELAVAVGVGAVSEQQFDDA